MENNELKNKNTQNEEFNMEDIFWEEFAVDSNWSNEEKEEEKIVKKDFYYYLDIVLNILKSLNIIFFIFVILAFSYVYFQNWKDNKSDFLNPVCKYFVWDVDYYGITKENSCYSVSYLLDKLNNNIKNEKKNIYTKLISTLVKYYNIKDFSNSKEILFLLDKSNNKSDPLKMLLSFDNYRREFMPTDLTWIKCSNLSINWNRISLKCNAYSTSWNEKMPWVDWWWTSVSLASKFLDYLSKSKDFKLINKQKVFTKEKLAWFWAYTYRTPFSVELEKKDLILK